ncbi:MAG: hypothetical protein ACFE0O_14420 [Opitutales bacterium]
MLRPQPQPRSGTPPPRFSARAGMARKGLLLGGGGLAVALLMVTGLLLHHLADRGESLPAEAYAEAPSNFSGNRYVLDARIERQLGFREGVGRLILTRGTAGDRPLPLYADASLDAFSPNPGQLYRFRVRVDGHGILNIESYEKR